jgi:hypothetical protein
MIRKNVHAVVKNILTGVVFVVVAICLYRVHNRNNNIGERKNLYLTEFLPINNEDLTYQKFLNISGNKIISLYVGQKKPFFLTISARVSYIKIPQDQESGDTLYKSFMYKIDKFYQKIYMKFYISFIFPRTLYRMKSHREFSKFLISPIPFHPIQLDPIKVDYSSFISKRKFKSIQNSIELVPRSSTFSDGRRTWEIFFGNL